jgi:hypothetical protein
MALKSELVATRLLTRGPDGRFLSVLTGEETDDELRALVVLFSQGCPARQHHSGCPFRSFKHLYHVSLTCLINGMTRKALVSLIELECEVRNNNVAASCPQDIWKLAVTPEVTA